MHDAGRAIEIDDLQAAERCLQQALTTDPTYVEPALCLAQVCDEQGDDVRADELVDEAVKRGAHAVERLRFKAGSAPAWWHEADTRPYMEALVALGWRQLEKPDAAAAAAQFRAVFEMCVDQDPLHAGRYAAESYLRCGEPRSAVEMYAQLDENADVLYGRALALWRTDDRRAGVVSLWLGILMNGWIAAELLGLDHFPGIDDEAIVGCRDEAIEVVGRLRDVVEPDERAAIGRLADDSEMRCEVLEWGRLVRRLEDDSMPEVEEFMSPERIAARVDSFLERDRPTPRRLPRVGA